MNKKCDLSNVTENYLTEFRKILYTMINDMTNVEITDSISHDFILQMIPHHRAAIQMSQNILRYTTNICLQNIASNIISEQTKSIEDMQNIQSKCKMKSNSRQDVFLYNKNFDRITEIMFSQMSDAHTTNNINTNFIREMIPHHEGAIRMSNNALNFDICDELKPILHSIIISQTSGVRQMHRLLRCINNQL